MKKTLSLLSFLIVTNLTCQCQLYIGKYEDWFAPYHSDKLINARSIEEHVEINLFDSEKASFTYTDGEVYQADILTNNHDYAVLSLHSKRNTNGFNNIVIDKKKSKFYQYSFSCNLEDEVRVLFIVGKLIN